MRGRATSVSCEEQIADGDRLVAVRAGTTGTDPTAEGVAVRAALVTEGAGLAGRALVDDGQTRRAERDGHEWSDRLAAAPGGLTAGIRAEATATGRAEAPSADGAGYR